MTRPTYDVRIDWNNDGDFTDAGENVTARALARTPISIQYGRDQARSLAPIAPGRAALELNNRSRDYSPENTSSPLAGNLMPGRPVRIQATFLGVDYVLYRGFLDDYNMSPEIEKRSVSLTALDALARLKESEISTDLYGGIRTGQAIGYILDAVGWPATARDLDQGATIIRWWWEEGTDAFTALQKVVESEGPPALVTVDTDGNFVFRDRHHRVTRAASLTSQATFRSATVEPCFSAPLVYDLGWRDIVNTVTLTVEDRHPQGELSQVWSSSATYTVADGETILVTAQTSDPFLGAVVPVAGIDYQLLSGVVTVTLSNTVGASTTLLIKGVGGPAVLADLQLRAYSLTAHIVQVAVEDADSIAKHGRRSFGRDVPWVGVHDALAVGQLILAQRAERLPVVSMRLVSAGGSSTRILQQLSRDLSDRVTIVEPESGLSADFFIEQIQHIIDGMSHETVLTCEKIPVPPQTNLFRFDVSGSGFNDGMFAPPGAVAAADMFRFDVAGQGFNDGLLAY